MSPLGRLPCATHPKQDELLSSWFTRLAHAHMAKSYTFGKLLLPTVSFLNRDLDKIAPEVVLQTLAARTATPLLRIRETALRRYEGRLYLRHNANGNTNWLLPLGIYHRTHRRYGLLFCPACLHNDGNAPYYRTHWRLALSHVCTKCGLYLQEKCPSCARPVTFFRVEVGRKSALPDTPISQCYHCALDLASIPGEKASSQDLERQMELESIMREGWKEGVIYPHLYFDVLHQIIKLLASPNPRCAALQIAVDKQTEWSPMGEGGMLVRTGRTAFELLPLQIRSGLLRQACWLLKEWPIRFLDLMRQNHVTSTPLLHSMPEIPFWYHDVVQTYLHMSNRNRRFGDFWA